MFVGKRTATIAVGAAMMASGVLATSTPAAAATLTSRLVLTVHNDLTGAERSTTLTCQPPSGTHPKAVGACATLAKVAGSIAAVESDPQSFCTMEFSPVTATAVGSWQGEPVAYEETFSNRCLMIRATGPVFDF